jgi:biopolymer transport protein ExbB/TolQ
MNLLGLLENGLFALGQVLRFPVTALLWVCVAAVCFMAGSCFIEFLGRRGERKSFNIKNWLRQESVLRTSPERLALLPAQLQVFVRNVLQRNENGELGDGGIEHLLLETEEGLKHSLNPSRMLVKVGPSLGLLGTLIPMGISLASMAAGNLEAMAGQMVVAFTSTIIGLSCGTAAFVVNLVRQGWVNQIIREQRFIAERIAIELNIEEIY